MTNNEILWKAMQENLPKRTWIPVGDIFAMVKQQLVLDDEDLASISRPSSSPRWKVNVRVLLRQKQESGTVRTRRRAA